MLATIVTAVGLAVAPASAAPAESLSVVWDQADPLAGLEFLKIDPPIEDARPAREAGGVAESRIHIACYPLDESSRDRTRVFPRLLVFTAGGRLGAEYIEPSRPGGQDPLPQSIAQIELGRTEDAVTLVQRPTGNPNQLRLEIDLRQPAARSGEFRSQLGLWRDFRTWEVSCQLFDARRVVQGSGHYSWNSENGGTGQGRAERAALEEAKKECGSEATRISDFQSRNSRRSHYSGSGDVVALFQCQDQKETSDAAAASSETGRRLTVRGEYSMRYWHVSCDRESLERSRETAGLRALEKARSECGSDAVRTSEFRTILERCEHVDYHKVIVEAEFECKAQ